MLSVLITLKKIMWTSLAIVSQFCFNLHLSNFDEFNILHMF